VAVAIDRFGGLDVLFNNAGIGWTGSFAAADESAIHRVLDADLVGPMKMTQAALPALRTAAAARADGAAIVFTASGLGLHGRAMISLYSVAKHGIIGLARSLALELGQENIRVNAVCPGIVDTQMVRNTTGAWGEVDTVLERFRQSTPLQRNAEPIDIANAALFLASAEARMITGTALLVDGGNHEA
jgi:3-oxoacyl-[acyl-carrier protein] reductase